MGEEFWVREGVLGRSQQPEELQFISSQQLSAHRSRAACISNFWPIQNYADDGQKCLWHPEASWGLLLAACGSLTQLGC